MRPPAGGNRAHPGRRRPGPGRSDPAGPASRLSSPAPAAASSAAASTIRPWPMVSERVSPPAPAQRRTFGRRQGRAVGARNPRGEGEAQDALPLRRPPAGRPPRTSRGRGPPSRAGLPGPTPVPEVIPARAAGGPRAPPSPKRMVSGTTMTLCLVTNPSVRSHALSVTIRTPGMGELARGATAQQERRREPGCECPGPLTRASRCRAVRRDRWDGRC